MLVPRNEVAKTNWGSINISLEGEELGKVGVYTYLGVDLDDSLSMNVMIDSSHNKANRKVYLLTRIRPHISAEVANQIYKTCILPILDYVDFLIDSGNVYNIGRLNNIQRRSLKVIDQHQHYNAHDDELLNIYGLIPLEKRRELHMCAIMFRQSKIIENIDNYKPNICLRNRNKLKFKKPFTSLTKVLKSVEEHRIFMYVKLRNNNNFG